MATVQGVTVEVGHCLRSNQDGWEGYIVSIDDTMGTVIMRMNSGDVRLEAVTDLYYNWWDPKLSP